MDNDTKDLLAAALAKAAGAAWQLGEVALAMDLEELARRHCDVNFAAERRRQLDALVERQRTAERREQDRAQFDRLFPLRTK